MSTQNPEFSLCEEERMHSHERSGSGLDDLQPKRPLIIGHRGSPMTAPENTLPSFRMAMSEGAEMIEMDIRPTEDGFPVICHDPTIPIQDGKSVRISETRLEVLRQLPNGDETHLPSLEGVLGTLGRQAAYNIELKEHGVEDAVLALVHGFGLTRQTMISSFNASILERIRSRDPCVPLGQIHDTPVQNLNCIGRWFLGRKAVRAAHKNKNAFVVLERNLVSPGVLKLARKLNKKCLVWTVNDEEEAKELAKQGVFGLITDFPSKLSKLFPDSVSVVSH